MVRTRAQERAAATSGQKSAKTEDGMPPEQLKAEKKHMQKTKERIAKNETQETKSRSIMEGLTTRPRNLGLGANCLLR